MAVPLVLGLAGRWALTKLAPNLLRGAFGVAARRPVTTALLADFSLNGGQGTASVGKYVGNQALGFLGLNNVADAASAGLDRLTGGNAGTVGTVAALAASALLAKSMLPEGIANLAVAATVCIALYKVASSFMNAQQPEHVVAAAPTPTNP